MLAREVNLNEITYSDVKVNNYGGKVSYVKYDDGRFVLQTPKMMAPFGFNSYTPKDKKTGEPTGETVYSLDLSFGGDSQKTKEFFDLIQSFDEKVIQDAINNHAVWFPGEYEDDDRSFLEKSIKKAYTPQIRVPKEQDKGYPSTMKFKFNKIKDGEGFTQEVYTEDQTLINSDDYITAMNKGCRVVALIQCNGVWFSAGKFGITWKLIQTQVFPSAGRITGFSVRTDEDDDEEEQVNHLDDDDIDAHVEED